MPVMDTESEVEHFLPLKQVALGSDHTCGLNDDGSVWCWGDNGGEDGILGDGSDVQIRATPRPVSGLEEVSEIVAGVHHTCALKYNGSVWCWGNNSYGQLGDGTQQNHSTPVRVQNLSGIVNITSGWRETCAIDQMGYLWCWGSNIMGIINPEFPQEFQLTPTRVGTMENLNSASIAGSLFVVSAFSQLWCTSVTEDDTPFEGMDFTICGAIGHDYDAIPVRVGEDMTVEQISHVGAVACFLSSSGSVFCWGYNFCGELGIGNQTLQKTPVPVSLRSKAVDISVGGGETTCAILADGSAWCWGSNELAQLGIGVFDGPEICHTGDHPEENDYCSTVPVQVQDPYQN
jgi:alpha-tubulin suppressor-like RCC1 family protein